jgi:hypothetical protein
MPNIKHFVSPVEQGFLLNVPIDETFTGIFVNSITMFVAAEAEDDWYSDSDLAVVYSTAGSYTSLDAMNMFYWHDAYTGILQDKLVAAGFSANAARNVATSEWGMQDVERASYDAYTVADEVRAAML